MKVLLCGAQGFIGRHLLARLRAQGHQVLATSSRNTPPQASAGIEWIQADFRRDLDPAVWRPRLEGVDAVINAVGVLRDRRKRPMEAIHHLGPAALFEACAQAGVGRVLQISALGIAHSETRYACSKRAAETRLQALQQAGRLNATLIQPSIVFGPGGASSALFLRLARLPVLLLPAEALQCQVQALAVADLAEACERLLGQTGPARLAAVGPQAQSLADLIASLRQELGQAPAWVGVLPGKISRLSARLGDCLPFQPWGRETLTLLQQPNCADPAPMQALLGRPPRHVCSFLNPEAA
ncbi:uncharacterized protein YbjT (DUF2867 family) [Paucibacter oligotrophus]|uniref:Uncharacterized protein YbjT (DUF2867 family) n=1 Tax=Roseateles oligotrophus TaxID=1769250 RepID=A0A840L7I6_9BURK|nr:NAD-dependent epimerase/dehydratase family protein [Roseateles oligotrophus]MBB4844016.1 uncharacterized protein YbjT (DUF2867 family) [Roseateles oligotrophus]